jgi:hypothetical protein
MVEFEDGVKVTHATFYTILFVIYFIRG